MGISVGPDHRPQLGLFVGDWWEGVAQDKNLPTSVGPSGLQQVRSQPLTHSACCPGLEQGAASAGKGWTDLQRFREKQMENRRDSQRWVQVEGVGWGHKDKANSAGRQQQRQGRFPVSDPLPLARQNLSVCLCAPPSGTTSGLQSYMTLQSGGDYELLRLCVPAGVQTQVGQG